jgi:hypothetical protein
MYGMDCFVRSGDWGRSETEGWVAGDLGYGIGVLAYWVECIGERVSVWVCYLFFIFLRHCRL